MQRGSHTRVGLVVVVVVVVAVRCETLKLPSCLQWVLLPRFQSEAQDA